MRTRTDTSAPAAPPVVQPRPDIDPERVRKPDDYCPEQVRRLASPEVEP
jgi:hypothetical protein